MISLERRVSGFTSLSLVHIFFFSLEIKKVLISLSTTRPRHHGAIYCRLAGPPKWPNLQGVHALFGSLGNKYYLHIFLFSDTQKDRACISLNVNTSVVIFDFWKGQIKGVSVLQIHEKCCFWVCMWKNRVKSMLVSDEGSILKYSLAVNHDQISLLNISQHYSLIIVYKDAHFKLKCHQYCVRTRRNTTVACSLFCSVVAVQTG